MEDKDNRLEKDHCLSVVLPGGLEKTATVHGSKPVMDLLVTLCARYHLNPSDYTVEVLSANKNNISFKPNSPIGSLEADKILLKPKGMAEKIRGPYMPEATVRLLINYRKSHKAVVRVNPRVPLELLMPAICSKCEFDIETTILLRDSQSHEPLDLTKALNDHGLREVFAKNTAAVTPAEVISPPPPEVCVEDPTPPKREKKQKENKGFFSLFRRSKKPEMNASISVPGGLNQRVLNLNSLAVHSSDTLPADNPKKRRAPQPPLGVSQSVPNSLSTHHLRGSQSSADSTLRRTKRRAPPPPCGNSELEDTEVKGTVNSLYTLQEQRENEELDSQTPSPSMSSPSSPQLPSSSSSSSSSLLSSVVHLQEVNGPCLPTSPSLEKELPDDACFVLAQILTSSLSDGMQVTRLNNSATFPRMHNGSSSSLPLTQQWPRNGSFRQELGSKLKLRPSADFEWQDPRERKGLTTFKVVPVRKQKWHEVELTLGASDQNHTSEDSHPTSEASAEALGHQTETQGNPGKTPESEGPLRNSEPCPLKMSVSDTPSSPPPLTCPEDEPSQTSPIPEVEEDECSETSLIPEVEEDLQKVDSDGLVSATVKSESPPASLLDHSNGDLATDASSDPEQGSASLQSPSEEPLNIEMDQIGSEVDEGAKVDEIVSEVDERTKVDEIGSEVDERTKVDEICSEVDERTKVDEICSEVDETTKVDEIGSDVVESTKVDEDVKEENDDYFPPPPPPVFYDDEEEEEEREKPSSLSSTQPSSPTCNGQTNGSSGDHLVQLTSPKPYHSPTAHRPLKRVGAVPSCFAQAVALAVHRSRSQSKGRGSRVTGGPPCSSPTSPGPCTDTVPEWFPHTSVNGSSCLG